LAGRQKRTQAQTHTALFSLDAGTSPHREVARTAVSTFRSQVLAF
jgi:hypothetical protein